MVATKRMKELEEKFESDLLMRATKVRLSKPEVEKPNRPPHGQHGHVHSSSCHHSESGTFFTLANTKNSFAQAVQKFVGIIAIA